MGAKIVIKYILSLILIQQIHCDVSSCDDYVEYSLDEGKKIAIITIPAPGEGETKMSVSVALVGMVPNDKFEMAQLTLKKDMYATMYDAMKGEDIQYKFILPQSEKWPVISKININFNDICQSPRDPDSYELDWGFSFIYPVGVTHISVLPDRKPKRKHGISNPVNLNREDSSVKTLCPSTPSTPSRENYVPQWPVTTTTTSTTTTTTTTTPPTTTTEFSDAFTDSKKYCGTVISKMQPTHLIKGGQEVLPGEFPWMVALWLPQQREYKYRCAGTLISDRHVITAAHCVEENQMIYIELGRHNISDERERNFEGRYSTKVYIHPQYHKGADSDVAIIEIDPVRITDKIRPICLCRFDSNTIKDKRGTVAGWGKLYDDGGHSTVPNKVEVNKVDLETCRKSDELLNDVTENTFCAGGRGKGPCHGDSGSGFYQFDGNVWYLRGIVSSSIGRSTICRVDKYAIYVDILYFLDFINIYLR